MKKIISLLLVLVLIATVFTGCTSNDEKDPVDNAPPASTDANDTEDPVDEEPAAAKVAKLGLGQNISIAKSKEKGTDANGNPVNASSQADVTMAAVGFDADGKVTSVTVDVVQAKVAFDEEMNITSDKEAEVLSKKDLKEDYNMKGASAIGKEWYEQMAAFEEWMIGKTVDEIVNLPVKERDPSHKNVPDVPELTSTVTITVESYIAAVEEAWDNAIEVEGGETVGLGVKAGIGSSKALGTDANGNQVLPRAQADVYMAATAFDADGKVVGTIIDTAQVKVDYDAEGKITTDKAAELKTKHELKEDYGMKGVSASTGIGREWYEQMTSFQEWMVGKSIDEIVNLPVKEANPTHQHVPDVPELTSTVTITVEGYLAVVEEAAANAR
ncbi:MAG: hypothetical protein RIN55_08980 [Tissierellaceae bacterium]|nr:hypothetical protein [Tissierellaceae bacterium]